MTWVAFGGGVLLLALLVVDIHQSVFVPRGGSGPLSTLVYQALWQVWSWLGERFTGARRRWLLAQLGPLLVPTTVMMWGAMLIGAFALILVPWASGFSVSPAESGPLADWAMVVYYSGYSAATLGVGDVVPDGTIPRLLVVVEAAFGFALFTSAISYLLSVYSARNVSTKLSLLITRLIDRDEGEDVAGFLAGVIRSRSANELNDWFEQLSDHLARLIEAIGQYPQVQYFHESSDDRALPIALADLLALTTTCRALLSPDAYPTLADGPSVRAAHRLAVQYLRENAPGSPDQPGELAGDRRRWYETTRQALAGAGVELRPDDAAWARYESMVATWDLADARMRHQLGY